MALEKDDLVIMVIWALKQYAVTRNSIRKARIDEYRMALAVIIMKVILEVVNSCILCGYNTAVYDSTKSPILHVKRN
jgi:hypothetical protein